MEPKFGNHVLSQATGPISGSNLSALDIISSKGAKLQEVIYRFSQA